MTISALQSKLNSALVTNAAGDYALRTMAEGDQTIGALTLTDDANAGGNYLLNEQTTTNMMAKGTVYEFNGTSDFINVDDLATHLNNTNNTTGAVNWAGIVKDFATDSLRIWQFGDTNANEFLGLYNSTTTGILRGFCIKAGTIQWAFNSDNAFSIDTQIDIRLVQNGTSPVLYVNGILEPITFTTSTDLTAWFADLTGIDNGRIGCSNDNSAGNAEFFKGTVNRFGYDNFAPTAAEVKDLISGNIPFKWQFGSQTGLITGDDSDFDTDTGNWLDFSGGVLTGVVADWDGGAGTGIGKITLDTGTNSGVNLAPIQTVGKAYFVSIKAKLLSGASVAMRMGDGAGLDFTPTGAETTFSGIVTAETTAFYIYAPGATAGQVILIDDVVCLPLGAVALYDQTSISETFWYDKANGNDGAVTGASVLNDADSIASTFVWHLSGYDFVNANGVVGGVTVAGMGAYPTAINEAIRAPLKVPTMLNGKKMVLDQITIYFNTAASGDDFDFGLQRTDHDGTETNDATLADIGNGGTGSSSATVLSSPLTLSDFGYYVFCDINNTDAATDVKIFDIKFEGHLA